MSYRDTIEFMSQNVDSVIFIAPNSPERVFNPDSNKLLCPSFLNGRIKTREEWMDIRSRIDSFYDRFSDDDITEIDDALDNAERQSEYMNAKPDKPKMRPKIPGYVYLLFSENGFCKIGKSKSPADRLKTLSVKLPFDIEPLSFFVCDDYNLAERMLHEHFSHKRVRGEWFNLSDEDICKIIKISEFKDSAFLRPSGERVI